MFEKDTIITLLFITVLLYNSNIGRCQEILQEDAKKVQNEVKVNNIAEELDLKQAKYNKSRDNIYKENSDLYIGSSKERLDKNTAMDEEKNKMNQFKYPNLDKKNSVFNVGIGTELSKK